MTAIKANRSSQPAGEFSPKRMASYATVLLATLLLLSSLGDRVDAALALPPITAVVRPAGVVLAVASVAWMVWVACRRRGRTHSREWIRQLPLAGYSSAYAGFALAQGSWGQLGLAMMCAIGIAAHRAWLRTRSPQPDSGSVLAPMWRIPWYSLRPAVNRLANAPVFVQVGPTVWTNFGIFAAVATALGTTLAAGQLARAGLPTGTIVAYIFSVTAAMAVGTRMLWVAGMVRKLGGVRRAMRSVGTVSWGAYLGLLVAVPIFAAGNDLNGWWLADQSAPAVTLGFAVGRLGCVSYGCCFGRPWRHGVIVRDPRSKIVRQHGGDAGLVPRFPVQVLSALATFVAGGVALLVSLRPATPGTATAVLLLVYGVTRFGVDALRDRSFDLPGRRGWKPGQIGGIVMTAAAVVMLYTLRGEPVRSGPAAVLDWSLLLPVVAAVTLAALVGAGLHWRQVGRY